MKSVYERNRAEIIQFIRAAEKEDGKEPMDLSEMSMDDLRLYYSCLYE